MVADVVIAELPTKADFVIGAVETLERTDSALAGADGVPEFRDLTSERRGDSWPRVELTGITPRASRKAASSRVFFFVCFCFFKYGVGSGVWCGVGCIPGCTYRASHAPHLMPHIATHLYFFCFRSIIFFLPRASDKRSASNKRASGRKATHELLIGVPRKCTTPNLC